MSQKLILIKGQDGALRPYDRLAEKIVEKWKVGKAILVSWRASRKPKFHRLAHGMAVLAVINADEDSFWHCESESEAKMKAHDFIKSVQTTYDLYCTFGQDLKTGMITRQARSIAFDELDEEEFNLIYDKLLIEVGKRVGRDPEWLRKKENYESLFRESDI